MTTNNSYTDRLAGKTIVITGASSGAGRAAALAFARYPVKLVLAARNEKALAEAAAECRSLGAEALAVPADVTDPRAMIALANAADDTFGRIDIWINNAGVLAAGPFDEMPMALHEQVIRTNLLGYMNGSHAVLPFFKKQQAGILINNISIGGFLPVPYGSGYTASKFALRGFSEALKAELGEWRKIRVCDLFPAFLDTPGILHAANYTGKELRPAPPVYDPVRLAQAMVRVAAYPASATYLGSISPLFKFAHGLFPELMTRTTGRVMRRYFRSAAPIALSDGNTYQTVDYGMSTHGTAGIPGAPKVHRKYLAAALVASVAVGALLLRKRS